MCTFNMTSRESAGQPEDLSLNGPPHINAFPGAAGWKARRPVECKEVAEEDVPRSDIFFDSRPFTLRADGERRAEGALLRLKRLKTLSAPGARKSIRPAWA